MIKCFFKDNQDTIKYFVGKVIVGFTGLLLVSMYTYNLKPNEYGDYSLIIGIVNILLSIFIGWISSSASRYYDEYKSRQSIFLSNLVIIWFVMTIAVILLTFGVSYFTSIVTMSYLNIYVILLIVFMGFVMIFEHVLRAGHFTTLFTVITSLQSIVNVAAFYIANVYFHLGIESVFIAGILSNGLFVFLVIFKFKLFSTIKPVLFSRKIQTQFFQYGWPMLGIWALGWILNLSDRYIIKVYQTSKEVGIYDIAYKITGNIMNLFILPFLMAIFPLMVTAWNEKGKKDAEQILSKFVEYYMLLVIPIAMGLIAIRNSLFGTILSIEYIDGSNVLIYVSFGLLLNGFTQMLYKLWRLKENTKRTLLYTIIPVLINIGLNFIMIPRYGYISAAISTFIAYLVAAIIVFYLAKNEFTIHIKWFKTFKVLLSSMAMLVGVTILKQYYKVSDTFQLIFVILFGAAIYFVFLLLLGILKEERNHLKKNKQ